MSLLHQPRKYAALVAVGPLSMVVGLAFVLAVLFQVPAMELAFLWIVLNLFSVPAVIIGVWFDGKVIEQETGVEIFRTFYAFTAVVLAPLIGTVYLINRWRYFRAA